MDIERNLIEKGICANLESNRIDSDRKESDRMSNSANLESDGMDSDIKESDRMSNSANPEYDRMDSDIMESDRMESDRMSNSANPESDRMNGIMATCEGCCHLTGAMSNLAAEAADRARIEWNLINVKFIKYGI
jgi:hypothetical protein